MQSPNDGYTRPALPTFRRYDTFRRHGGCGHTKLQQAVLSTPTRTGGLLASFRTSLVRLSTSNLPSAGMRSSNHAVAPTRGEAIDRSADVWSRGPPPFRGPTHLRSVWHRPCLHGRCWPVKGCAWVEGREGRALRAVVETRESEMLAIVAPEACCAGTDCHHLVCSPPPDGR